MKTPLTMGLFEKRIAGDDSLMQLAKLRFQQAGMGTEAVASNPEQVERALQFRPWPDAPVVVHLPRDWNVADGNCQQRVEELARRFAGRVHGFVLHDHPQLAAQPREYAQATQALDSKLRQIDQ